MKKIPRPQLDNATILTAAQLNNIHFSDKHTRLTPDRLEKLHPRPVQQEIPLGD